MGCRHPPPARRPEGSIFNPRGQWSFGAGPTARSNRGLADTDKTHTFVQSYTYELPFGPRGRWLRSGLARWIVGDWQLNGILTAETGLPLNIAFSNTTLNAPGNNNRPNISGKPEIYGKVGRGEKF